MVKMLPIIVNNTIVRSSRGRTPGFGPGNGGSNPSLTTKCSLRLGVRTSGFHPGNRGSIPLGSTIKKIKAREKVDVSIIKTGIN